jgi:hypothetical protein
LGFVHEHLLQKAGSQAIMYIFFALRGSCLL